MKGEPGIIKLIYVLMTVMVIGSLWFMYRG